MITGAHTILYSTDPEADRLFFKQVLKFPYVDVGHGWLIFALPPSELAIHPADENNVQEFYLMCDDIKQFVKEMAGHKVKCSKLNKQPYGILTRLTLPGGGKIGVYEPKHERPTPAEKRVTTAVKKTALKKKTV